MLGTLLLPGERTWVTFRPRDPCAVLNDFRPADPLTFATVTALLFLVAFSARRISA
jgi:hypothetical protein